MQHLELIIGLAIGAGIAIFTYEWNVRFNPHTRRKLRQQLQENEIDRDDSLSIPPTAIGEEE